MSERGTFITEFIYCEDCLKKSEDIFFNTPELFSDIYPITIGHYVIAGQIHGSWFGEEFWIFESKIIPLLQKTLCHNVRIAVISDSSGEKIFNVFEEEIEND